MKLFRKQSKGENSKGNYKFEFKETLKEILDGFAMKSPRTYLAEFIKNVTGIIQEISGIIQARLFTEIYERVS